MSKGGNETKSAGAKTEGHSEKKSENKASDSSSNRGGPQQIAGNCLSWACKKEATRFNFCEEHYDHFKFGLIKKSGEPVSDYEKKYEHYLAHQRKRSAQEVA